MCANDSVTIDEGPPLSSFIAFLGAREKIVEQDLLKDKETSAIDETWSLVEDYLLSIAHCGGLPEALILLEGISLETKKQGERVAEIKNSLEILASSDKKAA